MECFLNWELGPDAGANIGFGILRSVQSMVRAGARDLADLFPFRKSFECRVCVDDEVLFARIESRDDLSIPHTGLLTGAELSALRSSLRGVVPASYTELARSLGSAWFSFDVFTYVARVSHNVVNADNVVAWVAEWLNAIVVPVVLSRNQQRIQRAIPAPPTFDIASIRASMWILESPAASIQGTAFDLSDVGTVTCDHVLADDTYAFRPGAPHVRFSVRVIHRNAVVDLAIVEVINGTRCPLKRGSSDDLAEMDHLSISGFPNYRVGDSGVLMPGLVVGFRPVSGVRRILTNAAIVAGTSGGPVVSRDDVVVGIAVTGSETIEASLETENHGIIPVEALDLIGV